MNVLKRWNHDILIARSVLADLDRHYIRQPLAVFPAIGMENVGTRRNQLEPEPSAGIDRTLA